MFTAIAKLSRIVCSMQVLAKKKSVADEAGMVLQSKVRQLQAATTS